MGACREHPGQRGLNLAPQGSLGDILEHPSVRTAGTEWCPTALESGCWDEFLEDPPTPRMRRGLLGRKQPEHLDSRGGGRGSFSDRGGMRHRTEEQWLQV